jgi:prophage regulatory protein
VKTNRIVDQQAQTIPLIGFPRWAQLRPCQRFGRETWRKMVIDGKAPSPIKRSERCVMWSNARIRQFLAYPLSYKAA